MKTPIGVMALILICALALTLTRANYAASPALSDKTVSYTTYDPIDLANDSDRNVIWMANHYVAGLSKIDATSMALIANVSFPASMEPYRVVYDGTSVWILTAPDTYAPGNGAPASIIKVNPDTLQWTNYTFPNDAGHMFGCALTIASSPTTGKEYIFAGLGSNGTNYHAYVERIDPILFPNNITEMDLRNTVLGHYDTQCREIIYDGSTVWVGGDGGRIYTVNIDSMNATYIGQPVTQSIFSGGFDGEYLWWGLNNGSIIKMNPTTYTFVLMNLQNAIRLIHRWAYDGNGYMWTFDYTGGYVYIINCATMEYRIFATKFVNPHAILYADNCIWIADNTTESAPAPLARLSRYARALPLTVNVTVSGEITQVGTNSYHMDSGASAIFTANVQGGTQPYSYTWYVNGTANSSNQSMNFTAQQAGTYLIDVNVTDSENPIQQIPSQTITVTIPEYSVLLFALLWAALPFVVLVRKKKARAIIPQGIHCRKHAHAKDSKLS